MRISLRVQHHPSRAQLLDDLLPALTGFADIQVIADETGAGTWATHRRCLQSMPEDASHLLVVQDDAHPCLDFAARVGDAVAERPADIVCLFTPGFGFLQRRVAAARRDGDRFLRLPHVAFVPCVAIVYPAAHAAGLLQYTDGRTWPRSRTGRADDGVIADYCRHRRVFPLATVPSLVDHRDEVVSIAKPSHALGPHRRACWFTDPC